MTDSSLLSIPGVGPARAQAFAKLGVADLRDLAFLLPRAYRDLGRVQPVANLLAGVDATTRAKLDRIGFVPARKGAPFCGPGFRTDAKLSVTWFGAFYLKKQLVRGRLLPDRKGRIRARGGDGAAGDRAGGGGEREPGPVLAVYPGTEALSQKMIRKAVSQSLDSVDETWDWIPREPARRAAWMRSRTSSARSTARTLCRNGARQGPACLPRMLPVPGGARGSARQPRAGRGPGVVLRRPGRRADPGAASVPLASPPRRR